MEPFATALFYRLRFLLTRMTHGAGETFHLHCFNDLDLSSGPLQNILSVPNLTVRSTLDGKPQPQTPQDEIKVIDAVLSDPLTRARLLAPGSHSLVIDFFGAADADLQAQQLKLLSESLPSPTAAHAPTKKRI